MKKNFEKIYNESIKKPEEFWQKISDDIFWFKKPTQILNKDKAPFYKWFEDGVTKPNAINRALVKANYPAAPKEKL